MSWRHKKPTKQSTQKNEPAPGIIEKQQEYKASKKRNKCEG